MVIVVFVIKYFTKLWEFALFDTYDDRYDLTDIIRESRCKVVLDVESSELTYQSDFFLIVW